MGLLPHLQYYQRYKSMIFQSVGKIRFVLWQPGYYNLLTEKKDKKVYAFEVLIFLKT